MRCLQQPGARASPAGAAPRVQAGAAGGGRRRAPGRQPPVPCRSLPATHARAPLYKATTNFSVLQDVCCVSACVSIPKCREVTSAAAPWRRHPVPRSGNLAQRQAGASRHLGSVPVSVIVGLLAPGVDRVDLSVGPGISQSRAAKSLLTRSGASEPRLRRAWSRFTTPPATYVRKVP